MSSQSSHLFPVFIIFSSNTLDWIRNFILEHTAPEDKDTHIELKVIRTQDGRETWRTLALFPESTYQTLKEKGYTEKSEISSFRVDRFELYSKNFPSPGYTASLFVPVPTEVARDDKSVRLYLTHRLNRLVLGKLLEPESWSLTIPLKSRAYGGVKGGCTICFDSHVDPELIAFVRLFLNDTTWETMGSFRLVCHWARDPALQSNRVQLIHSDGKSCSQFKQTLDHKTGRAVKKLLDRKRKE